MQPSESRPSAALSLLRFGVRGLRIAASSVAVVSLLRQQWLIGAGCALAWLAILAAPRWLPQLAEPPLADRPAGGPSA